MSYAEKNTAIPPVKDSVTTRLESLLGRLEKVHHRLSITVDRVVGPSPRATNDVEPSRDCLRRSLDVGHELLSEIESELDRLNDGL